MIGSTIRPGLSGVERLGGSLVSSPLDSQIDLPPPLAKNHIPQGNRTRRCVERESRRVADNAFNERMRHYHSQQLAEQEENRVDPRSIRVMCADRRGIFNYLRIPRTAKRRLALQALFRAPFFPLPRSLSLWPLRRNSAFSSWVPSASPATLDSLKKRRYRLPAESARVALASTSCPLSIVVLPAAGCATPPAPTITYARSTVRMARLAKSDRQPFHPPRCRCCDFLTSFGRAFAVSSLPLSLSLSLFLSVAVSGDTAETHERSRKGRARARVPAQPGNISTQFNP